MYRTIKGKTLDFVASARKSDSCFLCYGDEFKIVDANRGFWEYARLPGRLRSEVQHLKRLYIILTEKVPLSCNSD